MTPRRYYLLKAIAAETRGDIGQRDVWRTKQVAEAGTAFDASFPSRARLLAAGYFAVEDLEGVTEDELQRAGLNTRDSRAVLAALGT